MLLTKNPSTMQALTAQNTGKLVTLLVFLMLQSEVMVSIETWPPVNVAGVYRVVLQKCHENGKK